MNLGLRFQVGRHHVLANIVLAVLLMARKATTGKRNFHTPATCQNLVSKYSCMGDMICLAVYLAACYVPSASGRLFQDAYDYLPQRLALIRRSLRLWLAHSNEAHRQIIKDNMLIFVQMRLCLI